MGVTQRVVRGPSTALGLGTGQSTSGAQGTLAPTPVPLPCFHPIPESQPVLPCLLRRLLQRGAFADALALARRHEHGPHFSRSLEWLLFTTLEQEASKPAVSGAGWVRGKHEGTWNVGSCVARHVQAKPARRPRSLACSGLGREGKGEAMRIGEQACHVQEGVGRCALHPKSPVVLGIP